jgi:hypothetical protein
LEKELSFWRARMKTMRTGTTWASVAAAAESLMQHTPSNPRLHRAVADHLEEKMYEHLFAWYEGEWAVESAQPVEQDPSGRLGDLRLQVYADMLGALGGLCIAGGEIMRGLVQSMWSQVVQGRQGVDTNNLMSWSLTGFYGLCAQAFRRSFFVPLIAEHEDLGSELLEDIINDVAVLSPPNCNCWASGSQALRRVLKYCAADDDDDEEDGEEIEGEIDELPPVVVARLPAIARALQPLPRTLAMMQEHYARLPDAVPLLKVIDPARDNVAGAIAQLLVRLAEREARKLKVAQQQQQTPSSSSAGAKAATDGSSAATAPDSQQKPATAGEVAASVAAAAVPPERPHPTRLPSSASDEEMFAALLAGMVSCLPIKESAGVEGWPICVAVGDLVRRLTMPLLPMKANAAAANEEASAVAQGSAVASAAAASNAAPASAAAAAPAHPYRPLLTASLADALADGLEAQVQVQLRLVKPSPEHADALIMLLPTVKKTISTLRDIHAPSSAAVAATAAVATTAATAKQQ